jgi:ABC-type cobalamin/Fe3+-siderophores transport system ATPase subunit
MNHRVEIMQIVERMNTEHSVTVLVVSHDLNLSADFCRRLVMLDHGCLVADGVDNLMMAGRCISADHHAEASLRIQQTCMATGQAAGVAAALSLRQNMTPRELAPAVVIDQLAHDRDVEPAFDVLGDLPVADGGT